MDKKNAGSNWWFVISGWDEKLGEANTVVDRESFYRTGWPEVMDPNLAVFLVNEVIAAVNDRLAEGVITGVDEDAPTLPFLGTCRACGDISSEMWGPDSDVCRRCWQEGRR